MDSLCTTAQQGDEDRVGAVAVRPQLGEPRVGGAGAGDVREHRLGRRGCSTPAWSATTSVTTSLVSAGTGEQVT